MVLLRRHSLGIDPPLINSANPWATTKDELQQLYDCPYTGAVTLRTSLLQGFPHDSSKNQYAFFSSSTGHSTAQVDAEGRGEVKAGDESSLNTLGYSPVSLSRYIEIVRSLRLIITKRKPFIFSITGTPAEIASSIKLLSALKADVTLDIDVIVEINLSCPNIANKPPPCYDLKSLSSYFLAIRSSEATNLAIGVKVPPYTHAGQFKIFFDALEGSCSGAQRCPIDFITSCNTLGFALVLDSHNKPALGSVSGTGIGGMAGDALHPIALGNVQTIRSMLDASPSKAIKNIAIIGVGGVKDAAGYKRMRSVGADVVAVGTALGREGVAVFSNISAGLCDHDLGPKGF